MPSVEERLAYLEGRMGDEATLLMDLRSEVHEVRTELNNVRSELHELRSETNAQFAALRSSTDGKFTWLIGIQVAMILMFAGAILSVTLK
jgi:chromosome segregation ATPase